MKFAILGSGAVGGYFGARLARAGQDVTFIARGAHLEAIRAKGLEVKSAKLGDFTCGPPPKATPRRSASRRGDRVGEGLRQRHRAADADAA